MGNRVRFLKVMVLENSGGEEGGGQCMGYAVKPYMKG